MFKQKVIGIRHSEGEYNGYAYDNYVIAVDKGEGKDVYGLNVDVHKVKAYIVKNALKAAGLASVGDLLNRDIRVDYNRYAKVVNLTVL